MMSGVILAGGNNRRMGGRVKALLPFFHETLIERQIKRMKSLCTEIIVVTNESELYAFVLDGSMVRTIPDEVPGKGPLSGMHAALSACRTAEAWIVACDMPFISAQAARLMQDLKREQNCDAIVPVIGSGLHPLHGIYDIKCAAAISVLLAQDQLRVMGLLDRIVWAEAPEALFLNKEIDVQFVANINTPDEYERALAAISD